MIVSDIKTAVIAGIMIFMNWKCSLMYLQHFHYSFCNQVFQKYMKMAFQG